MRPTCLFLNPGAATREWPRSNKNKSTKACSKSWRKKSRPRKPSSKSTGRSNRNERRELQKRGSKKSMLRIAGSRIKRTSSGSFTSSTCAKQLRGILTIFVSQPMLRSTIRATCQSLMLKRTREKHLQLGRSGLSRPLKLAVDPHRCSKINKSSLKISNKSIFRASTTSRKWLSKKRSQSRKKRNLTHPKWTRDSTRTLTSSAASNL